MPLDLHGASPPCLGVTVRALRAWVFLLCGLSLTLPALAPARLRADATAPRAGYSALIEEAVQEASQAHFEEARALFAQAHALYPNARTLRGLAIMAYELRAYVESVTLFESALASPERALQGALRDETTSQLERARRFVCELKLALAAPDTRVSVDDQPVSSSAEGLVRLDPGLHSLRFEAAGYRSETRTLDVRGGERLTWSIALRLNEPAPAAAPVALQTSSEPTSAPPAPAPRQDAPDKPRLYRNPWLWAGVAVAVGALAVGLGFGLKDAGNTVRDPPTTSPQTPVNGILFTLVREQ
jgi:hypothetical protein